MDYETIRTIVLEGHAWFWRLSLLMFMAIGTAYGIGHIRDGIRSMRKKRRTTKKAR